METGRGIGALAASKRERGVRAITNKKPMRVDPSKVEVVKEDFSKGDQSLRAERIVRVGDLKLRAEVKRDSYDFQSYARVSAWTTKEGWAVVTTIPFESTAMKAASPYAPSPMNTWPATAKKDLDKLIALGIDTLA